MIYRFYWVSGEYGNAQYGYACGMVFAESPVYDGISGVFNLTKEEL